MKALRAKLSSRRGVTLTEMLVAVAVLGLVTLAVAVGISSSLRVYNRSVALSDAQTLSSTLSQALMDELRYARDIEPGRDPVPIQTDPELVRRRFFGREALPITNRPKRPAAAAKP